MVGKFMALAFILRMWERREVRKAETNKEENKEGRLKSSWRWRLIIVTIEHAFEIHGKSLKRISLWHHHLMYLVLSSNTYQALISFIAWCVVYMLKSSIISSTLDYLLKISSNLYVYVCYWSLRYNRLSTKNFDKGKKLIWLHRSQV